MHSTKRDEESRAVSTREGASPAALHGGLGDDQDQKRGPFYMYLFSLFNFRTQNCKTCLEKAIIFYKKRALIIFYNKNEANCGNYIWYKKVYKDFFSSYLGLFTPNHFWWLCSKVSRCVCVAMHPINSLGSAECMCLDSKAPYIFFVTDYYCHQVKNFCLGVMS